MDDKFKSQLLQMMLRSRRLGHGECQIAAMRMFEKAGMSAAVRLVGKLDVDSFLTAEEIASRDRIP